jgi:hypothetical protein
MVSKDRFKMECALLSIIDSICERFPDVPQSVRAGELARARSRSMRSAAEALERRGEHAQARRYWKQAYREKANIDALLALLGISAEWRRRVQFRGTSVRRILTWYSYKATARLSMGKETRA